jgi:hypothetical protein
MPDFEEMRNAVERATVDDIVTRLRRIVADPKPIFTVQLLDDAADEIERLRYRVEQMESEREYWQRRAISPY